MNSRGRLRKSARAEESPQKPFRISAEKEYLLNSLLLLNTFDHFDWIGREIHFHTVAFNTAILQDFRWPSTFYIGRLESNTGWVILVGLYTD